MNAKQRYQQAMERLYIACIVIVGRRARRDHADHPDRRVHALRDEQAAAWPEPASIVLMVMFSFIGGAAVYRANVHIAVEALLNAVKPGVRRVMRCGRLLCMVAMALFMLYDGVKLWIATQYQTMAEFPGRLAGPRLPADPDRRPASRCCSSSRSCGSASRPQPRSCTATRPRSWSRRWTSSCCSVPSPAVRARRAGRLRARPRARSSVRCGSTFRSRR